VNSQSQGRNSQGRNSQGRNSQGRSESLRLSQSHSGRGSGSGSHHLQFPPRHEDNPLSPGYTEPLCVSVHLNTFYQTWIKYIGQIHSDTQAAIGLGCPGPGFLIEMELTGVLTMHCSYNGQNCHVLPRTPRKESVHKCIIGACVNTDRIKRKASADLGSAFSIQILP
jgi:hypothetical protein